MTDDELPPERNWAGGMARQRPPKRAYVKGGAHGHGTMPRKPGCPECLAYYREWKQRRKAGLSTRNTGGIRL